MKKLISPIVFKNKKVLIVGFSMSNIAVLKYLVGKELALLTITDLKSENELKESVKRAQEFFPNARFVLGKHKTNDFLEADLIIRNPSVSVKSPFIKKAVDAGIAVETDVSLFFKLVPTTNIIGVTGTKGKTTTATFLAKMLSDQGFPTILAGNMGIPVMGEIDKVKKDSWICLELSSFMVESLERHKIGPRIAVYTSLFPDHLNTYKTYEDYKNSKKGLFLHQKKTDITFINRHDANLKSFVPEIPSQVLFFGYEDIPPVVNLKPEGIHYRNNIAAAFVLAKKLKLDMKKLKKTAEDFIGVEHRMEHLGIVNEVELINNSASTNPGSFLADAEIIIKKGKPVYLLAGGSDKKLDFSKMIKFINDTANIRGVVLFQGQGTDRLRKGLSPTKILGICNNMPQAFAKIMKSATKGSIVFLNPGCASFGVFKDEFDRGKQFKKEVEKLKAAA